MWGLNLKGTLSDYVTGGEEEVVGKEEGWKAALSERAGRRRPWEDGGGGWMKIGRVRGKQDVIAVPGYE